MSVPAIRVKCEAGHVTTVERFEERSLCEQSVQSALAPGTMTKCRLPVVQMLASAETQDANIFVRWALGMPGTCAMCQDNFVQGERVVIVTLNPTTKHHVHDGCYFKMRSDTYEQLFTQAHQTCAFLVASRGNRARISAADIARAQSLNCNFAVKPTPAGGLDIAFVDANISTP